MAIKDMFKSFVRYCAGNCTKNSILLNEEPYCTNKIGVLAYVFVI